MSLGFKLKFAIMEKMIGGKKKEAFSYTDADLFELPANAGPLINNSWFFGGDLPDGTSLKMRFGIRNTGKAEVFLIWIDGKGKYYATLRQEYDRSEAPVKVRNIIPGRDWEASFDGEVADMKDGSTHHLQMNLRFTARLPIFHPMLDGCTKGMSQALARERWTPKFFKSLSGDSGLGEEDRQIRQVHFEQTGRLDGIVTIDGREEAFSLPGVRDRAFGKRDWNYMDCHVWLIAMTDRGEAFNLSIVSYPHAKRFYCGYTDIGSDRNVPLEEYRIVSYDHCDGKGPDRMVVDCRFTDGRCWRITADRTHDLVTPFDGGNFYFHEAVGDYTFVEIPGLGEDPLPDAKVIKARGTIELGWNKDKNRWGNY